MRFEQIEITNYRQYRSLTMCFNKTLETDLHIVIASNGIGKTNLLNAIDWCLYGEESHLGDRDDSLSICNLDAIEDAKRSGNSKAFVTVKITATEGDTNIAFERSVTVSCSSKVAGVPSFRVSQTFPSGNMEVKENDEAVDVVNRYLPKKIRQYFFFDGEQLYNYFGKSQSTTHVKDSIHEIAQINVVTTVRKELASFAADCQKQISRLNPASEKISMVIAEKEEKKSKLEEDIDRLVKSNNDAQDMIDELTRKIAGTDDVVETEAKFQRVNARLAEAEKEKKTLEGKLFSLIKTHYVNLAFYDANCVTKDYISEKANNGSLPPDIDRALLIDSIKNHRCAVCEQRLDDGLEKHIEELLEKFQISSAVSNKLMEIKNDVFRAVSSALSYLTEKESIFKKNRELDTAIEELEAERENLQLKLSSCSSVDDVKHWVQQREDNRRLMNSNAEKIGSYKNQVATLGKELELQDIKLRESYADKARCDSLREKYEYARSAMDIVQGIENEIIDDVRKRMEYETFSTFANLIWKKDTYGHIELSEDYKLRLFHTKGDSCLGSCSAAERELLALAFTLALHKVSHHDSLLFIDTPVGRVSDKNREFFAKALISVSEGKQLILAFTPSEYSIEISKYFDDKASSKNHLESPDESHTVVKEGV